MPPLIDRLRALQTVHEQMSSFAQTIEAVQLRQQQIAAQLGASDTALQLVQRAFGENSTVIRGNVELLNGRIDSLLKRIERLGAK